MSYLRGYGIGIEIGLHIIQVYPLFNEFVLTLVSFLGLKDSNFDDAPDFGFDVVVDKLMMGSKSSNDSGAGFGGLYGTGLATTLYLDSWAVKSGPIWWWRWCNKGDHFSSQFINIGAENVIKENKNK